MKKLLQKQLEKINLFDFFILFFLFMYEYKNINHKNYYNRNTKMIKNYSQFHQRKYGSTFLGGKDFIDFSFSVNIKNSLF